MQPPIVDLRNAIVVDFVSATQSHAEASIQHGWNGPGELPMGSVATVYGRRETNEQNALIEAHMRFFGTAMTMGDFHRNVIQALLDSHSCPDPKCEICEARFSRGLAEAFQLLADGTGQKAVHLFSKWKPDKTLVDRLSEDGIAIKWCRLDQIPERDLEANRSYTIWDGSVTQSEEFLSSIWAPAWKRGS